MLSKVIVLDIKLVLDWMFYFFTSKNDLSIFIYANSPALNLYYIISMNIIYFCHACREQINVEPDPH